MLPAMPAALQSARKRSIKEAKHALYRERLSDAAEVIFARDGYDATRMQAIADEAGLSIATVYKLYPGKWELFRAVHDRRGSAMMARVQGRLGELAGRPPLDLILDGIALYIGFLLEHPDYLRMHLREGGLWASSGSLRSDEQVALWQGGLTLVAGIFRAAQAQGLLLDDDSPESQGRTMIAMQQARLALWSEGHEPQHPARLTRAIQRQFLRAFCPSEVAAEHLASLA